MQLGAPSNHAARILRRFNWAISLRDSLQKLPPQFRDRVTYTTTGRSSTIPATPDKHAVDGTPIHAARGGSKNRAAAVTG